MKPEEEKFRKILNDNHRRIYRICCYYFRNREDIQDLYQEILYNVWKSLRTFKGKSSVDTWIYRIALNTAIGYSSREFYRKKRKTDIDIQFVPGSLLCDDPDEEDPLEDNIVELYERLNQLSVIDKTIMTLMLEEIPLAEIADIVGITEPNVRVKIHRIKSQLKTEMKGSQNEK